jgi:uncharacterized protein
MHMFEHEKAKVDQLLRNDNRFKRLYDKHSRLNTKVDQASAGAIPMTQFELETLKKEKLMLRDRMQAMLQASAAQH